MNVYVDASAILKLHLDEPDSERAAQMLAGTRWVSGMHTLVEVRRNLARVLDGRTLQGARERFERMWVFVDVVELSAAVCEAAAGLAELTGVRALDALHLGAAEAAGGSSLPFVTFDHRLAAAARSLGWDAVGA